MTGTYEAENATTPQNFNVYFRASPDPNGDYIPEPTVRILEEGLRQFMSESATLNGETGRGSGASYPVLEVAIDIVGLVSDAGGAIVAMSMLGTALRKVSEYWAHRVENGWLEIDTNAAIVLAVSEVARSLPSASLTKMKVLDCMSVRPGTPPSVYVVAVLQGGEDMANDVVHVVVIDDKGQISSPVVHNVPFLSMFEVGEWPDARS